LGRVGWVGVKVWEEWEWREVAGSRAGQELGCEGGGGDGWG
jgi:hypothetical protein